MSKKKSIFVSALLSVLLVSLNAALYIVARPAFFVFLGFFALIGFLGYAVAFCKWLEKPSEEKKEDTIEPPIVSQPEGTYDFSEIIDEVRREAENEEK